MPQVVKAEAREFGFFDGTHKATVQRVRIDGDYPALVRERQRIYGSKHIGRQRDGAIARVGLWRFQLYIAIFAQHDGLVDGHGVPAYIAVLQRAYLATAHGSDRTEQDSAAEIRVWRAAAQRHDVVERRTVELCPHLGGQGDARPEARQEKRERGREQSVGISYGFRPKIVTGEVGDPQLYIGILESTEVFCAEGTAEILPRVDLVVAHGGR